MDDSLGRLFFGAALCALLAIGLANRISRLSPGEAAALSDRIHGHAAAWATGHGYTGPVDCARPTYRESVVTCLARPAMGQPPVALDCSATGCEEHALSVPAAP